MLRLICFTFVATFLTGVTATHAAIVPIAQLRQIAAGGQLNTVDENVSGYESKIAEDYGLFDESTGLALRTQFGTATADGFTKQVSNITPTKLSAYGSADSFVMAPSAEDSAYAGTGSVFSLRFALDAPRRYLLTASGFAQNAATAEMTLKVADAEDEYLAYYDAAQLPSFSTELFLPAGEYSISARADSNGYYEFGGGEPDGRSEIEMSFTQVPEPCTLALLGALTAVLAFRRMIAR
jgi:hypothetical protein